MRLGSDYGGWFTDVSSLTPESIVYSFGVGDDISWDREILKYCPVYAFDPDPKCHEWLGKKSHEWSGEQQMPNTFIFSPIGLSTYDGTQRFYDALKEGKINSSTVKKGSRYYEAWVRSLPSIMEKLGHSRIDILKMDIEGSEFAVIPHIAHLPIKQLLVEIHTDFYRYGLKGLRRLYGLFLYARVRSYLWVYGFELVHRHGSDFTFQKVKKRVKSKGEAPPVKVGVHVPLLSKVQ